MTCTCRFIKLKAEHAQIMNEENEKFVQRKQKQMQKQLQDAAREEVTVALEEGPAPGAFSTLPNQLITKFVRTSHFWASIAIRRTIKSICGTKYGVYEKGLRHISSIQLILASSLH